MIVGHTRGKHTAHLIILWGEDTLRPLQFQACLAASVVGNVSSSDLGHARRVRGSLLYASGLINDDQLNRGQEREGGGMAASLFLHEPQRGTNWSGSWPTLCGPWLEPTFVCRFSKAANSTSSGSSMGGLPDKGRFICSGSHRATVIWSTAEQTSMADVSEGNESRWGCLGCADG